MIFPKKTVIVEIEGVVQWRGGKDPDSGLYIGVCDALNLNVSGETWAEMQDVAREALEGLLDDLVKTGEFDAFLRRNGWRLTTPMPKRGAVRFDVPVEWSSVPVQQVVHA